MTSSELNSSSSLDWQTSKTSITDRTRHLLDTGIFADCQFVVGTGNDIRVFRSHKLVLAMSSPVFEAMFFGTLAAKDDDEPIAIPDVNPQAFKILLQYVYSDEVKLESFELGCDVYYASKKYMLASLVETCTRYLWTELRPCNVCRAFQFAHMFDERALLDKSLELMKSQTHEVVSASSFSSVESSTLCTLLSLDTLNADESVLFVAMQQWAKEECRRRNLAQSNENQRSVLGENLFRIRFLAFDPHTFAAIVANSGLLTQEESYGILMSLLSPTAPRLPSHISPERRWRRSTSLSASSNEPTSSGSSSSSRLYCRRDVMPEPHCLNNSILDCSLNFTVDRDVCIQGIEVPSQISESSNEVNNEENVDEESTEEVNAEYNELLYAHLLDADGNRLTYTHFTNRVAWNSSIGITFNRYVCIKANRIYRIGMVLNKVGWYPMGVCNRRVTVDNCTFTFCVGQPNDALREGLIRTIIFSK